MTAIDACAIIELRRYTLHPGTRDSLIALFDREFVETQEAAGMRVIGQFRDPDEPDTFVWLRGFSSMEARKAALASFYGGPVWAAHADEANATMVTYDNVFLLRPAESESLKLDGCVRPAAGENAPDPADYALIIYHLKRPAGEGFLGMFEETLLPRLVASGVTTMATLVSETSANTFPRLPVREGDMVLVSLLRLAGAAGYERVRALAVATAAEPDVARELSRAPEVSRLMPTERSLLR